MKFILLLAFMVLLSGCTITSNVVKENDARIDIYFCPQDMCKEKLLELIDGSKDIKCAFYDLNLPDVMSRLKEKDAEVIVEDSTEIAGFKTFPSRDLMHNKFCVFDGSVVFTGSMNPTENDNFYNNNNILIIRSKVLAENYLDEFEELKNGVNGAGNAVRTPLIEIDGVLVENYFCPEDNCKLRTINALKKANQSIRFMIFTFADEDIANLVYNKDYLSMDVKGVIEKRQSGQFSQYDTLKGFTRLDDNPHTMHHKVFIIDESVIITGSYNPTGRGNTGNDENVMIIHDRKIAQKYLAEFEKVYDQSAFLPTDARELEIIRISNNPEGKDEGNEFFEVKNIGLVEVNLDYYSATDNSSSMRLRGILNPGEIKKTTPKFAIKNKEGVLILRHNDEVIDYAMWGDAWNLYPSEGQDLVRIDKKIRRESWLIEP